MTKKKRGEKKAQVLQSGRDGGTPELREKLTAMDAMEIGHSADNISRVQNSIQGPLDYYKKRRWITDRQYDAGMEFYRCWYFGAVKAGMGISRYDTMARGQAKDAFDVNQTLHDKYEKAKKAIRGLAQALTCYNVCCAGEWASALTPRVLKRNGSGEFEEEIKRLFYSGRELKMQWLKSALDDLADHWRYPR